MEKLRITQFHDDAILNALPGTKYIQNIKNIFIIGGHRFQEYQRMKMMFHKLQKFYVFEPVGFLVKELYQRFQNNPQVEIHPIAVGDFNGSTYFNISDNDAASSSLLEFKEHKTLFPEVSFCQKQMVDVHTINRLISDFGVVPDLLFIDAQGAEYRILSNIDLHNLMDIQLIYTEVSLIEVYEGAKTFEELRIYLEARNFHTLFYTPLMNSSGLHGNALFINRGFFDGQN